MMRKMFYILERAMESFSRDNVLSRLYDLKT